MVQVETTLMMNFTQDDITAMIENLVQSGATQLHLKVPNRPQLRMGRDLVPTSSAPLCPESTMRIATILCGLARVEVQLNSLTHHEFSFGVSGLGRFHAILYRQRGSIAIQLRRLVFGAPTLSELGFDERAEQVLHGTGLHLICGDHRRHHVLASLIAQYNQRHRGLVVVIEDPLTTLHRDGLATIVQRGVGTDVPTMAHGVISATRQYADVIGLGDIPDLATSEAVLRAAESGALVLAAVAAPEPALAASWLLRQYASDRDQDATNRVKRLLRGVFHLADGEQGKYVARRLGQERKAA